MERDVSPPRHHALSRDAVAKQEQQVNQNLEGRDRAFEGRQVTVVVPQSVQPGVTHLKVDLGADSTSMLLVLVPEHARPGDKLILENDSTKPTWQMHLCRAEPPSAVAKGPEQELMCRVSLSSCEVDPRRTFERMAEAARNAGGFVSQKLTRGEVASSGGMMGMIAKEHIEEGEELFKIPSAIHISDLTVEGFEPELAEAIRAAPNMPQKQNVLKAACVAKLLGAAMDRLPLPEPELMHQLPIPALWDRYADALIGEDFGDHPYWLLTGRTDEARRVLEPSHEWEQALVMSRDLIKAARTLLESVSVSLLGERFSVGLFLQARLCILTRVFNCNGLASLVPLVDLCNHSPEPGAVWLFDVESDAMLVTACRRHIPGDHICISYGQRPNPLLFRTYGFTLPPCDEPCWTFVLQGRKPKNIYEKYLPPRFSELNIHFDTAVVQHSLVEGLNAVQAQGHDAADFLRVLCTHCKQAYDADASLKPAIAALQQVREANRVSGAWWTNLTEHDLRVAQGDDPELAQAALRVKMSEYLCIIAHIEIADVADGLISEDCCLEGAQNVRNLLLQALEELRNHGRFSMTSEPVVT